MSRKTFSVEALKNRVNGFISADSNRDPAARQALSFQLESILLETGNYEGFTYLDARELDIAGAAPGINTKPNGQAIDDYDAQFAGTDSSRRKYF